MAPEQFGRYRIEGLIGAGGMGEVHRAVDTEKDRVVALKRLTAGLAAHPDYRARFHREAQLVARLAAPHIIPIHDYGQINGRLYLDMPLVRGIDGAELVARVGALPLARAVEIIAQTAEALDAAHGAGLAHRDVKPSNLLITGAARDFVYLIDFGLVHDLAATAVTATGGTPGTLAYMAPERFEGHGDHRVDVYSLACVLHELLTGTRPYLRDTFPALIYAHLNAPVPSPSAGRPGLPPGFDDVVARGMAKDPQQRFASAGELADAAREALHSVDGPITVSAATTLKIRGRAESQRRADAPTARVAPTARAAAVPPLPSAPTPLRPTRRRRRRLVVLALLAAVALGAGALLTLPILRPVGVGSEPPTQSTPTVQRLPQVFAPPRPVTTIPLEAVDVEVAPDGALVYLAGGDGVDVLDARTHADVASVPIEGDLNALAISPDGRFLYAAGYDPGAVVVIDTGSRSVVATIPTPEIANLVVSADGSTLYAAALTTGTVLVVDTATRQLSAEIPVGANLYDIELDPDGRSGYVSVNDADTVAVVDLAARTVTTTIPVGQDPGSLALTSDGARLYASIGGSQEVAVIDTAQRAVLTTVRTFGLPTDLVVAQDDRWVYVTDLGAGSASVLDARTDTLVASVPFGSSPAILALHPDGRRIYAVNLDEPTVSVLDLAG